MIQNKIVVRFKDGRIIKGQTSDFQPTRPWFHVAPMDEANTPPIEVRTADVKAIFFVKDFAGNNVRKDVQTFSADKPSVGRKIKVEFNDGEILLGTTQGYDPNREGFFIIPADKDANNERCFVVASATRHVEFV